MIQPAIKVTARCPIRTTIDLLGGKWKLLILFQLAGGALRLSVLKRQIPDISEKMLIQELKLLQDSQLVARNNFGEVPPRVEYELTEKGRQALPLIEAMARFANAYQNPQEVG
jgi:DNA-binding HxlR family transcriptional regulator